jgi:hypothetical protein
VPLVTSAVSARIREMIAHWSEEWRASFIYARGTHCLMHAEDLEGGYGESTQKEDCAENGALGVPESV